MSVLGVQISTSGLVPNTSGLGLGLTQQMPTPIFINTNDTLATVTTTGYLTKSHRDFQYPYNNYQMAEVYTTDSGVVWLRVVVTFSGGHAVYSLVAPSESGSITTPTVANQIAYATNTLGTIAAAGLATALFNAGNISAGLATGTAGILESYPGVATSGKLILAAVTNAGGNFNTTISNAASIGQSQVLSIPDTGASAANLLVSKLTGTQHITVGSLAVDAGTLTSGIATGGVVGKLTLFPTTTTNGSLVVSAVGNVGNFTTTVSDIAGLGQSQVLTLPDVGAATGSIMVTTTAAHFKSVAAAAAAGGNAAQSFTDAFCTTGSTVVGNWNTQANAVSVLKIVPGNGSFVVTSSGDAGVGTFGYIITK